MNPPSAAPTAKATKAFLDGTHRVVRPEETLERIRPFFSDFGITRVANVTGLDTLGIPTVMVVRPNARSLSVAQGKGRDLVAAKASGIMEAVERFHAEQVEAQVRLARLEELERGCRVVDVQRLPHFIRAFHRHERVLWIEARDFRSDEPFWVPYEMVHLDFTLPLPTGSGYFLSGSNGLASGNHPLEAIAHGLYELVERDGLALFYRQSAAAQWERRVDLDSVDDPSCRELLSKYRRAGIDVAVWDIGTDIGIASFLCLVLEREPDPFRPVGAARGSGCHPDRSVALSRALCEAAQSRLTRIAGTRDDMQPETFERVRSTPAASAARAQLAQTSKPPRTFGEVPTHLFASFDEEMDWACEALAKVGLERVLVIDLSRSEYPVSVARVIVPGLEGTSQAPGYVPGVRALRIPSEDLPCAR